MIVEPEQVLFPGERLLWTGRPQRSRRSLQELGLALYLVIAAPVVIAFSVVPVFAHSQPRWFIAAVVIVAVGALGQAGAYLAYLLVLAPRTRASMTYAVTDRRVIVTTGLRSRTAKSAYISTLRPPRITKDRDETSTVRFGKARREPWNARVPSPLRREAPTLTLSALSGADAAAALAAIQQVRHAPSRNDSSAVAPLDASASPPVDAAPDGWMPTPGEQVLWVGRPSRVRWWYGQYDVYTSLFGIVFVAMAALIEWATIASHAWPFTVFDFVFVVFGLHLVIGRVFWRRARIRHSSYLVTTRRVVTIWNLRETRAVTARLADVHPAALSADGTLTFTVTNPPTQRRSGQATTALLSPAATNEAPVFLDLADAVAVYRLVGAVQAVTTNTATPAG